MMSRLGYAVLVCGVVLWSPAARAEPPRFVLPLKCELGRTCAVQSYVDHDPTEGARDYRCGTRTYHNHNGTDFRVSSLAAQQAGVEVLAAADGTVERIRNSALDAMVPMGSVFERKGLECGNGVVIAHADGWQTQYCHMAKDSVRVRAGERVKAGQPLGQIGLSGNTQFPHVHFTVRHNGKVVDPFAHEAKPDACGSGNSLWREALPYLLRELLNAGFASGPVTMAKIESGELTAIPERDAPALVAYARAIGLQKDDVQQLKIVGPDQQVMAENTAAPLEGPKAQSMLYAGRKRPAGGWPGGSYEARYTVTNGGAIVLERRFAMSR
jgi:hypothetical protein